MDEMNIPKKMRKWYENMDVDWWQASRLRELAREGEKTLGKIEQYGSDALSSVSTRGSIGGMSGGVIGGLLAMIPGLQWAAPILVGGGTFLGSKVGQNIGEDPYQYLRNINTGRNRGLKTAIAQTVKSISQKQSAQDIKAAVSAGGSAFLSGDLFKKGIGKGKGIFKSTGIAGHFSEEGITGAKDAMTNILAQTGTTGDDTILSLIKDLSSTGQTVDKAGNIIPALPSTWDVNNPSLFDKLKGGIGKHVIDPTKDWIGDKTREVSNAASLKAAKIANKGKYMIPESEYSLGVDSPEYYTAFMDYMNPQNLYSEEDITKMGDMTGFNDFLSITQSTDDALNPLLSADLSALNLKDPDMFNVLREQYPEYTSSFDAMWSDIENNPLQSFYQEGGHLNPNVGLRQERADILGGSLDELTEAEAISAYTDFGTRSAGYNEYQGGQMRGQWVNGKWVWDEDMTNPLKGLIKPENMKYKGNRVTI